MNESTLEFTDIQDLLRLLQLNSLERTIYILALYKVHSLDKLREEMSPYECLQLISWYECVEALGEA